ncbi:glycoside hydrolase family 19 protein [uncultured Brachyspira sp.]|uniref:glycoside hydrolase family 19 protein n=1 Tax=uncultured Brachyspira sp. TaxID=221953 RepID=UPI00258F6D75|nr:glycoside hydrolase family 19 protein [uncultured Brachyspira sp.]
MLTKNLLEKIDISIKWLEPLTKSFSKYSICASEKEDENINELSMFLAQCGHESINFTRLEENLNYSANTLLKLFPKKIKNIEKANEIVANGVVSIANAIYGNRTDLGNIMPNDGWKYRGRGIIQLTGRNNYKFYGEKIGADLINNPDLAREENNACLIACAYWNVRGLTKAAREGNVQSATKKINGGYNGLEDRENRFRKIKAIIENDYNKKE